MFLNDCNKKSIIVPYFNTYIKTQISRFNQDLLER